MLDRRTLLIIGAVLLGLFVLGVITEEAGGPEGLAAVFIVPAALTIFNPIFWIVFIILMVRGRGGGQQQQQQIVVVTSGSSQTGPQLRCPDCKGLSAGTAAFCGHCGRSFVKA